MYIIYKKTAHAERDTLYTRDSKLDMAMASTQIELSIVLSDV